MKENAPSANADKPVKKLNFSAIDDREFDKVNKSMVETAKED